MTKEQLDREIDGWNDKIKEATAETAKLTISIAKIKDSIDYYQKHKKLAEKQLEIANRDTKESTADILQDVSKNLK